MRAQGAEPEAKHCDRDAQANRAQAAIARAVGATTFARYFEGQTKVEIDGSVARVRTPSRFHAAVLDRRFAEHVRSAVRETLGDDHASIAIEFCVDERLGRADTTDDQVRPETGDVSGARRSHTGPRRPAPAHAREEAFLIGESNRLAHEAVCRLCHDEQTNLSPLVVHGPCGVGKTHLLNTALRIYTRAHPGSRVRFMTADAFTTAFVVAIREGKVDRFRNRIRSLDLLCIDDTHFLSTRDATQGELVQTLDAVGTSGARILLASDEHPRKIRTLRAALRSRMLSGMVVHVAPPDPELAVGLVELFASRRGIVLDRTAAGAVVSAAGAHGSDPVSVRELMGAVNKLAATRSLLDPAGTSPVGLALVRRAFESEVSTPTPTGITSFDAILGVVCNELGVLPEDLASQKRHKRIVAARATATLLARETTTMSYPEIARAMGKPSHSTVITAAQRYSRQVEQDQSLDLGSSPPQHLIGLTPGGLLNRLRAKLNGA